MIITKMCTPSQRKPIQINAKFKFIIFNKSTLSDTYTLSNFATINSDNGVCQLLSANNHLDQG